MQNIATCHFSNNIYTGASLQLRNDCQLALQLHLRLLAMLNEDNTSLMLQMKNILLSKIFLTIIL